MHVNAHNFCGDTSVSGATSTRSKGRVNGAANAMTTLVQVEATNSCDDVCMSGAVNACDNTHANGTTTPMMLA